MANYLTNWSPTHANSGFSPYQRLFKKPPDLHHLHVVGCLVFVHKPDERRSKLDSKTIKCILVGYSKEIKAYKCYEPGTRLIYISRDVHFAESRFWHTSFASTVPRPSLALESLLDHSAVIEVFDSILTPSDTPSHTPALLPAK